MLVPNVHIREETELYVIWMSFQSHTIIMYYYYSWSELQGFLSYSSIYFLIYHRYDELHAWAILTVQLLFPPLASQANIQSFPFSANQHESLLHYGPSGNIHYIPLFHLWAGYLCKSHSLPWFVHFFLTEVKIPSVPNLCILVCLYSVGSCVKMNLASGALRSCGPWFTHQKNIYSWRWQKWFCTHTMRPKRVGSQEYILAIYLLEGLTPK